MTDNAFAYVTYIRITPEKLWHALTDAEFNKKYWLGAHQESDWKKGSSWRIAFDDGRVPDSGEVLEIEPLKRIVLKWRHDMTPEVTADGFTRCTFDMEQAGEMMKLTVRHEADGPHKLLPMVSKGWPLILSSLKTALETGEGLARDGKKAA